METSIRSFIAIELPAEAHTVLTDLQNRLNGIVPARSVRWTPPQNIHLTLHFLGDIAPEDVEKIRLQALEAAAAAQPPFALTIAGLGCFPNLRRPRIVWVGLQGELSSLQVLYRQLGAKLAEATGFKPDTRPYSPHLTVGRVRKGMSLRQLAQLGQALEQEQSTGELIALPATEICLFKSELKPDGPIYTRLCVAELKD